MSAALTSSYGAPTTASPHPPIPHPAHPAHPARPARRNGATLTAVNTHPVVSRDYQPGEVADAVLQLLRTIARY